MALFYLNTVYTFHTVLPLSHVLFRTVLFSFLKKLIKRPLKHAHWCTGREWWISLRKPGVKVSVSGVYLCFSTQKLVCLAQRGCFKLLDTEKRRYRVIFPLRVDSAEVTWDTALSRICALRTELWTCSEPCTVGGVRQCTAFTGVYGGVHGCIRCFTMLLHRCIITASFIYYRMFKPWALGTVLRKRELTCFIFLRTYVFYLYVFYVFYGFFAALNGQNR